MKKLILVVLLAMQSNVAFAAQSRFSDELLEINKSPVWSCMLAAAGDEQSEQKTDKAVKGEEEEPDCE